jgi:hypothetical protein
LDVPRATDPPAGRFGRMLPTLQPRPPAGLALAEKLGLPGGLMDGGETTHKQDSPTMDAGFTFFGQFIDHNITLDVTSMLGRQIDPDAIQNFRPIDLTGTRDGQFLYIQVGTTGGLDSYGITSEGTLTPLVTLPVPNSAEGIAVN